MGVKKFNCRTDKGNIQHFQSRLKSGKKTTVCLEGIFYEGTVTSMEGTGVTLEYTNTWKQTSLRD